MTRRMFDAVNVGGLPRDGDLYAGYVDGNWPNIGGVTGVAAGRPVVSIAVRTSSGAAVFDTEPGNPDPEAAAAWVVKERARGNAFAGIYTMRSWWGWCVDALRRRGIVPESVPFWIADATGRRHELAGAVATQWLFAGSYDESVVADFWPGVDGGAPAPPPPAPEYVGGHGMLMGLAGYPEVYHFGPGYIRHVSGEDFDRLHGLLRVPWAGFQSAEDFRSWARTWGVQEGTWPL